MRNNKYYYSDGTTSSVRNYSKIIHRENGPAIEHSSGTKEWYINGKLHRENGPAVEWSNGDKSWYINGNLHREDGPAIELINGNIEYYLNGNFLKKEFYIEVISLKKNKKEYDDNFKNWSLSIDLNDGYNTFSLPVIYFPNINIPNIAFTPQESLKQDSNKKDIEKVNQPKENKFYYSDGTISSERDYSKVLHREDGPAVEYSNGIKEWFINGQLHREDGPAREYSDGSVEYYLNSMYYSKENFDKEIAKMNKPKENKFYYSDGTTSSQLDTSKVLHREDGPAVECDGTKEWFINGKSHREDGPAVEYSNGCVEYWLNDKEYSKEDFDKEIQNMKKQKEDKFYYSDGTTSSSLDDSKVLHREDGPACEWYDGIKEWYKENKLHRLTGPAVIYPGGDVTYYIEGECYTKKRFDKFDEGKFYYSDGTISNKLNNSKILHRDGDLPAVEYANGDKWWYKDGKRHRLTGPAVIHSNGNVQYWVEGNIINETIYKYISKTTAKKAIQFFENDVLHRENGPAFIDENVIEYWVKGKLHRKDGPAREYFNGDKIWYEQGIIHRENGPAKIYANGRIEYYKYGKKHNTKGPAVIDEEGNELYFEEGKFIKSKSMSKHQYENLDKEITSEFKLPEGFDSFDKLERLYQKNNVNSTFWENIKDTAEEFNNRPDWEREAGLASVQYNSNNDESVYNTTHIIVEPKKYHQSNLSKVSIRIICRKATEILSNVLKSKFPMFSSPILIKIILGVIFSENEKFSKYAEELRIDGMANLINFGIDKIKLPEIEEEMVEIKNDISNAYSI